MAECDWAILCDYAFLDIGKKLCMIGAFERVLANTVPTALHQSALALKILGNPEENIRFRIEVCRPNGGSLAAVEGAVVLAPDASSANVQLNFAGLALPDWGIYSVNVHVNGDLSRTASFSVVQAPQAPRNPAR